MNDKLLKLVPLLIVIGVLGYSAYSIHPVDPEPLPTPSGPTPSAVEKTAEAGGQAVGTEQPTPVRSAIVPRKARDPFRTRAEIEALSKAQVKRIAARKSARPASKEQSKEEDENTPPPPPPPPVDPYIAKVRALALNATFLQGRDELAVIDGRIYQIGQSLEGTEGARIPLRVTKVSSSQVILQAGDKRYSLGYPALGEAARAPAPVASRVTATAGPSRAMVPLPDLNLDALDPEAQAVVGRLLRDSPLGAIGTRLLGGTATDGMPGWLRSGLISSPPASLHNPGVTTGSVSGPPIAPSQFPHD